MMIASASGQLLKPTDTQTSSTHLRSFKHSFLNLLKPSVHAHTSVLTHKLQFTHDEPLLAHAATASTQAQAQMVPPVAPSNAQVAHDKVSTWKMKAAIILVAVLSFTVFTTVNADPAAAQAQAEAGTVFTRILESPPGKIMVQLAQLFAVFLIFATLTMQTYKVYKSGAGFASALPTIIGAFVVGGVLFNLGTLANMVDFMADFVGDIFESLTTILPGGGETTAGE